MSEQVSWYSLSGKDDDVVLSSRVRFARNLANFVFPAYLKDDEAMRVQALIFDGLKNHENLHFVNTEVLDMSGRVLLEEKGILKPLAEIKKTGIHIPTGIIMSSDGSFSCTVNTGDHLHCAMYKAGDALRDCYSALEEIDLSLQDKLQFSASFDFGYLTASLRNAGSGIKCTVRVHIPSIMRAGKFSEVKSYAVKNGVIIFPSFPEISNNSPAGHYFTLSSYSSQNGSEIDQLAAFESVLSYIKETERKISTDFADNKSTVVLNSIVRAYSIAKTSLLISLREAVDIISDLKFGLRIGLIEGIEHSALSGLLYRIHNGHLLFLMDNGAFKFEGDVASDTNLKVDRIRAIILQEAFNNLLLRNL